MDQVTSLKDKGNEAFKMGQLEDALKHYSEAIDLSEDEKLKAIILSNRAQTHLKLENYFDALKDAEDSLKLDPTFKKSILRRATANVELGNHDQALVDLRTMLKSEPQNKSIPLLMKRCSDFPQMSPKLREAYVTRRFRHASKTSWEHYMGQGIENYSAYLKSSFFRQLFLSTKNLKFIETLLPGAIFTPLPIPRAIFGFSKWFSMQLLKQRLPLYPIASIISIKLAKIMLELIRPEIFELSVNIKGNFDDFKPFSQYRDIYTLKCSPPYLIPTSADDFEIIEKNSDILTRVMSVTQIVDFKKSSFPSLKTVFFDEDTPVDTSFLEMWKKQEWPATAVYFSGCYQIPKVFKSFDGVISNQVTDFYRSFGDNKYPFFEAMFKNLCNDLNVMKRVFPQMSNVFITHDFNQLDYPLFFNEPLKLQILNMCALVDKKPEWCQKLKIMVGLGLKCANVGDFLKMDIEPLAKAIKSYRHELTMVQDLKLRGPNISDFTWYSKSSAIFVLEFKTDVADWKLSFHTGSLQ